MDDETKLLLKNVGFEFNTVEDLIGNIIPRDQLLCDMKYEEVKKLIPILKNKYSSTFMTSLQRNASNLQKWPLLNLVRQILSIYRLKMTPIRKSDGYTLDGKKRYKRYFNIEKNKNNTNTNNDTEMNNDTDNIKIIQLEL
jgi:uncharacterized protein YihD (DUF1040 family)